MRLRRNLAKKTKQVLYSRRKKKKKNKKKKKKKRKKKEKTKGFYFTLIKNFKRTKLKS